MTRPSNLRPVTAADIVPGAVLWDRPYGPFNPTSVTIATAHNNRVAYWWIDRSDLLHCGSSNMDYVLDHWQVEQPDEILYGNHYDDKQPETYWHTTEAEADKYLNEDHDARLVWNVTKGTITRQDQ